MAITQDRARGPRGRLLNDSMQTFTGLLKARADQLEGA